jgi:hypothetical protein
MCLRCVFVQNADKQVQALTQQARTGCHDRLIAAVGKLAVRKTFYSATRDTLRGRFSDVLGLRNQASKPNAAKPVNIIVQLVGNGVALTDAPPTSRTPSEPGARPGPELKRTCDKSRPLLPAPTPAPPPRPLKPADSAPPITLPMLLIPPAELRNPATAEKLPAVPPVVPFEARALANTLAGPKPLSPLSLLPATPTWVPLAVAPKPFS